MADKVYYRKKLGMFKDVHCLFEDITYTKSQDITSHYSTESSNAYELEFGEKTVELSLDSVPLQFEGRDIKKLFDDAYTDQEDDAVDLPDFALYDYNEKTGTMKIHETFLNCAISKIEFKASDNTMSIDMTATGLLMKT